jgi:predicted phosphodiesterase
MRYAVLSDIHSNLEALTAVTEVLAAAHIDRYLCLGDVVGYGADPSPCLERLRLCEAVVVAGNHDLGCLGKLELDWFNEAAQAALVWTRDQLGFAELDELRRWPLTTTVGAFTPYHGRPAYQNGEEVDDTQKSRASARGTGFTLVHGTLRHPERFEYLVDLAQAVDTMTACRTLMCLVGHTHLPGVLEFDRSHRRLTRILTTPEELSAVTYHDDEAAWRYVVNPGSVGQPRDGDPRASVAVIDDTARTIAIQRIAYDVASAQRKIRQAGLPDFLADRLAAGR